MTEIFIHGRFGEVVGKHHQLACATLSEVFRAIQANTGKLRKYIRGNVKRQISLFVDGKLVDEKNYDLVNVKNKKVVILPLLMGAVGFTIVMAVTKLKLAKLKLKHVIVAMVINMAFSIGVSLIMSKMLAPDDPESASTSSYIFAAAENVTRQGRPVPVGYGRFRMGSTVISATLLNIDKSIALGDNFYSNLFETTSSPEVHENQIDIVSSALAKSTI